jgi:HEPN domain-containing protein
MPDKARANAGEWFKKAEDDALSVRAILKEGAPSTACFLSQQIAEKYLKGLLVFHNKPFPKVHDLIELESLLVPVEKNIQDIHNDLVVLNRYYIETRYPGDYPEFTAAEAREAFETALRIKEFVTAKTGKSF